MGWFQKMISGQAEDVRTFSEAAKANPNESLQISFELTRPSVDTSQWPDERIAQCPNCSSQLKKIPGAKTKCPECKEFMYVRTDPRTESRRVVSEKELEPIEREWAKLNGTLEEYEANIVQVENTKTQLRSELGRDATRSELDIRMAEVERKEYLKNHEFGMLRNTYLTVAQIQSKEGNFSQALTNFLIVALLDGNGCSNSPAMDFETFEIKDGPLGFDAEFVDYLPYIAGEIKDCVEKGSLDLDASLGAIDDLAEVSQLSCPKGMRAVWKEFVKKAQYPT
jgi:hypothetical protein